MIDVLTPFGLSVVYLTTDAMPSTGARRRVIADRFLRRSRHSSITRASSVVEECCGLLHGTGSDFAREVVEFKEF